MADPRLLVIYADGSASDGVLGYGAVALYSGQVREIGGRMDAQDLPHRNDYAELLAIRAVLAAVAPTKRVRYQVYIRSDCRSIVDSLRGEQGMDDPWGLLAEVRSLIREFHSVNVAWVRRNSFCHLLRAHELANEHRRSAL